MKLQHLFIQVLSASLLLLSSARLVQAAPYDPTPEGYQSNERDPSSINGIDPMDLIRRATITPSRSTEDFNNDSQQGIQSAAQQFKQQQIQKVQGNTFTGITAPTSSGQP